MVISGKPISKEEGEKVPSITVGKFPIAIDASKKKGNEVFFYSHDSILS